MPIKRCIRERGHGPHILTVQVEKLCARLACPVKPHLGLTNGHLLYEVRPYHTCSPSFSLPHAHRHIGQDSYANEAVEIQEREVYMELVPHKLATDVSAICATIDRYVGFRQGQRVGNTRPRFHNGAFREWRRQRCDRAHRYFLKDRAPCASHEQGLMHAAMRSRLVRASAGIGTKLKQTSKRRPANGSKGAISSRALALAVIPMDFALLYSKIKFSVLSVHRSSSGEHEASLKCALRFVRARCSLKGALSL